MMVPAKTNKMRERGVSMLSKTVRILLLSLLLPALPAVAAGATDLGAVRASLKQGAYDRAIDQVEDFLAAHPNHTQARFLHGLALARAGHTDAAITVFSKLAEDHPDLAQPRNNLGVLYAEQRRYEEARKVLEQAVRINPSHAPAQENLGDVYVWLARRAYDRAAQLEPDNAGVRAKRQRLQALLESPDSQTIVSSEQSRSPATASPQPPASSSGLQKTAAQATPGQETSRAAVRRAVQDWARAWSNQNVDAYLASYSEQFDPEGGQSYADWRRERRQRLSTPGYIRVEIGDMDIDLPDSDTAVVRFRQSYRSDSYHDQVRKTLRLRHDEANGWQIVAETTD